MSLAATLTNIRLGIIRYFLSFIFAFGIIGSILNIILFSRRKLRRTSCCACMWKVCLFFFSIKN